MKIILSLIDEIQILNSARHEAELIYFKRKMAEENHKRLEAEKKIQELSNEKQRLEFSIANSRMNNFQSQSTFHQGTLIRFYPKSLLIFFNNKN